MPEIRSVSVHLDADVASYIAKMKAAGKATDDAFSSGPRHISDTNTALKGTETELAKVDSAARKVDTSMRGLDQTNQRVTRSQDRLTGGMRILVNTALALGPALVPIGAVAIPAVAGLSAELGSAVLGVGVAELAFHGLGKTLTAFDKAALQPTTANIAAAQLAMSKLPPSAQLLVLQLHQMEPVLNRLRQSAASGLAPGVTSGLKALEADAPVVNRAVHSIGSELGHLADEAGRSLSGPEWRGFIRTVGQQAPRALDSMGRATGDVIHGLAQLYLAFGPSLGSFDRGVVRVADDFDRWATSLGQTKGFQSFLAYVALNGPRVTALLGDTASLLGDIVKAAAPLGGPTLQALDAIVKVLDAIANSPLGTPLLLLVQMNAVLHLTNNVLGAMGVSARIGFGGITKAAATADAEAKATTGTLSVLKAEALSAGGALRTMYSNVGANAAGGRGLLTGVDRGGLAALGKGALLAGGVGLLASGLPSKLGASNTATLALAGSFGGPLVAALGAGVGAILDVSHATDGLTSATHTAQSAIKGWDLSQETAALTGLNTQLDKTLHAQSFDSGTGTHFNPLKGFEAYATRINDFFTHSISDGQAAAQQAQVVLDSQKTALALVGQGLSGTNLKSFPSDTQLQGTLTRIQPALDALGVTTDQLAASAAKGGPAFQHLITQIKGYLNAADSTKGRTQAVADAFTEMSNANLTADQRVQALTGSLDALVNPMLTLGGATDTFQQDLNDLGKNLAKHNRSLVGNTDAEIQNRNVIRGAVGDLKAKIEAEANANASSQKMSATLRAGRQAIIDQGRAAGLNAGQIQHMIDTMHLTPKLIKTLFQAEVGQALTGIAAVDRAIAGIDRVVNVHVNVTRNTNALLADVNTPKKRAGGGAVYGPGTTTSDSIPALLSNREFVMSAASVDQYGLGFMHAVNARRFADGGMVDRGIHRPGTDLDKPLFTGEGPRWYKRAYQHGRPFAKDGPAHWDWPYQTGFDSQKEARDFERWVNRNNVPFNVNARHVDYDMRGYWKRTHGKGWHPGDHFPDTWKTPYDTTFSDESKYATGNNPFYWRGNRLFDHRSGQLIFGKPMAAGGIVTRPTMALIGEAGPEAVVPLGGGSSGGGLVAATHSVTTAFRGLKAESASLTKQLAAERQLRQKIAQERATLVSTVRDGFRPSLFGTTAPGAGIWSPDGGLTDPLGILNSSIHDARAYTRGIATLRRRGLRGGALAQVQTTAQLQQALGLSRREDRRITDRFGVEQRASQAAGNLAGDFRFGQHLASIDAEVKKLAQGLHQDQGQIKAREHAAAAARKQHAHDIGQAVAKGINGPVGKAAMVAPR